VSAKVEVALQPGQEKLLGPVRDLVKAVLAAEGASGSVSVAFVEEQEIAELNKLYRGVDAPTDVLSFREADSEVGWPDSPKSRGSDLGEVVVCPDVVGRYSFEEGGDPDTQMGWTILHGTMHLLGYDHETDDGEMRTREQALLGKLDRQVRAVGKGFGG
jgi:probable rRNA maturation factor